jgi:hypothetical protein
MNAEWVQDMLSMAVNFIIDLSDAVTPPLASTVIIDEAPEPVDERTQDIVCHGKTWVQDSLPVVIPETIAISEPEDSKNRAAGKKPKRAKRCTIWSGPSPFGIKSRSGQKNISDIDACNEKTLMKNRSSCCFSLGRGRSKIDGSCHACRFLDEDELKELIRENRKQNR